MAYDINVPTIKSYATRENLVKALTNLKIADHPHMVVRNDEGRWTAIFPQSNFERKWLWDGNVMPYIAFYASLGFMQCG
jgi:hypothetical protein